MLAAMDNPYLTIIGHPTGPAAALARSLPIDLDAVIEKAAATGVALEINADPHRLDLDWRVLRRARDRGVAISIGADAHSVAGPRLRGLRRRHGPEGMARRRRRAERAARWTAFLAHVARRAAAVSGRRCSGRRPDAPATSAHAGRASAAARAAAEILSRLKAALPRRPLRAGPPERLRAALRHDPLGPVHRRAGQPGHARRCSRATRRRRRSRGADPAELEEIIKSTGFFRNKTRSLIGMAQALVADHGGEVPRTMEELRRCPASAARPPTSSSATPSASTKGSRSTPTSRG